MSDIIEQFNTLANTTFITDAYISAYHKLQIVTSVEQQYHNQSNDILRSHSDKVKNIKIDTIQFDQWLGVLLDLLSFMYKYEIKIHKQNLWVDCHRYWLFLAPQRSPEWLEVRKGRVSGSILAKICQDGKYDKYSDPHLLAREICGIQEKIIANCGNITEHGTITEPTIRKWHEKTINSRILELPFAIPKWCLYIGVSLDAYIYGSYGIGEYKSPQKMYEGLEHRIACVENGIKVSPEDTNNIIIDHLYQMYLGMSVFGKSFCDYVVYDCVKTNKIFYQRIIFDKQFWCENMYPKLKHFIETSLIPIMPDNYPLMPS